MSGSGWESSAAGWIAAMGARGDRGRAEILDPPMREAVRASGARRALDVGCGEGRFCRMMAAEGLEAVGIDPTEALLDVAQERDPQGRYLAARGEALPFEAGAFDLVVSYLTLIDIEGYREAIAEMARVLAPGGTLLVANLAPHVTALPKDWGSGSGWVKGGGCRLYYAFDNYMEESAYWTAWGDIRIVNHHRPLSAYMQAFLGAGLALQTYDEPPYLGDDPEVAVRYRRVPWFNMMIWRKPGEGSE